MTSRGSTALEAGRWGCRGDFLYRRVRGAFAERQIMERGRGAYRAERGYGGGYFPLRTSRHDRFAAASGRHSVVIACRRGASACNESRQVCYPAPSDRDIPQALCVARDGSE
jgi:hypothetical protein